MSTPARSYAIPGVLAVANGKGGTGKTSLVANLSGLAAAAGIRTLTIDLDPQGNLSPDLGLGKSDGIELRRALEDGAPLPISTDPMRPGLGVVRGGPRLADIISLLVARGYDAPPLGALLHRSLSQVMEEWDLVVIDTPPGDRALVEAAFSVAEGVVIVSKTDLRSLDGVAVTAERFQAVHESTNPDVQLLGLALFDVEARAVKIEREARQALEQMLQGLAFDEAVFTARIRHAAGAAQDLRKSGRLVHELESDVARAHRERFARIKAGEASTFHASTMDGLAGDYAALAQEILGRLSALGQDEEEDA